MPSLKESVSNPERRGLSLLAIAFLLLTIVFSLDIDHPATNWLGFLGYWIGYILVYLFGITVFPIVGFVGWIGWKLLLQGSFPEVRSKIFYFSLCMGSCSLLLNLAAEHRVPIPGALQHKMVTESITLTLPFLHHSIRHNLGGVPFYYLYKDLPSFNLQNMMSDLGVGITCVLIGSLSFLFWVDWRVGEFFTKISKKKKVASMAPQVAEQRLSQPKEPSVVKRYVEKRERMESPSPPFSPVRSTSGYQLPPPSLLTHPQTIDHPQLKKELSRQAEILEESLLSFGIEAKVGDILCGPTIISFEIHPAVGVKVQKITALENDIALNLQAKSIRILAPIPGKAVVGIEVPSPYPQEVSFKEMLLAYQKGARKLHIPIILGKTVSGEDVVTDLAKMPHCLIAGATGSGKSVCINTIIMSILMNATPEEIKMILIDPKKVELTPYSSLPHLIAPVITEPHGAYAALNWMVKEMQTRYDILKHLGLRNIFSFNSRKVNLELESSLSISVPEKMVAIVAIIDEFADLMMASSSDLETPIARIAQMARAVGIHLVLATQRPSREVITGLIKANFPTRIAFKVASRVNSQIILDDNGAESLLGNGDMLFLPPGTSHLMRAQGVYVSDEDIQQVLRFICDQAAPSYQIASFDSMAIHLQEEESSPKDSLYEQAKIMVVETQSASTTYLQRKLKIGYARAASLIDELEMRGVISAQEGSKPRRVLIEDHEKQD